MCRSQGNTLSDNWSMHLKVTGGRGGGAAFNELKGRLGVLGDARLLCRTRTWKKTTVLLLKHQRRTRVIRGASL